MSPLDTTAQVLLEQGRPADARPLLRECLAWARATSNPVVEYHVLLSDALACLATGDEHETLELLRGALRLGREHSFVTHPWIGWRRDLFARLAAVALEHDIETDHVTAVIEASRIEPPEGAGVAWPWPVRVRTLGRFEVLLGRTALPFGPKVQRKPLELLRAIVAHGGIDVREEVLLDTLWPDADGDAAQHALEMTVHRLRKLRGIPGAIVQRDRMLSLDPKRCWVDALVLRRSIAAAHVVIDAGAAAGRDAVRREAARIAALYRGPFLTSSVDERPWAGEMRNRIRAELGRYLEALQRFEGDGSGGPIVDACRRQLVDADPVIATRSAMAAPTRARS